MGLRAYDEGEPVTFRGVTASVRRAGSAGLFRSDSPVKGLLTASLFACLLAAWFGSSFKLRVSVPIPRISAQPSPSAHVSTWNICHHFIQGAIMVDLYEADKENSAIAQDCQ